MAKADRLARLDERRAEMELEYRDMLIAALRRAATGQRGLFGHDQDKRTIAAATPMIQELSELGDDIDQARDQLSMPPFDLHRDFLASRGPVKAHAVGEAKQAQAWLAKLDTTTETSA